MGGSLIPLFRYKTTINRLCFKLLLPSLKSPAGMSSFCIVLHTLLEKRCEEYVGILKKKIILVLSNKRWILEKSVFFHRITSLSHFKSLWELN